MAKDFHILALSGGGFRGLYTATILAELEKVYKKPFAQAFDLICGTSIGGILALGLAAEVPATKLQEIFLERGKEIFKPKLSKFDYFLWKWKGVSCKAVYSQQALKDVLLEFFEGKTIGDLKHRVLIPTVSCTTGLGKFLKTPHHPTFCRDCVWPLVDVALATSAAPTYFPIFENKFGRFVDGGLVGNSPGLFGYHEAKHFLNDDGGLNIRVLSIGTANQGFGLSGSFHTDGGFLKWGSNLFDLLLSAQDGSTEYILRHLLGDNVCHINVQPSSEQSQEIGLDKADDDAIRVLKELAMDSVQKLLGKPSIDFFLNYQAEPTTFYYGSNKNVGD